MTTLTPRYVEALDYARVAHATQFRKGSSVPYVAHLLGVSSLVLDYGGDEDQAIAALLHDVVEDQGRHHLDRVRERFGERVAAIVAACTDGALEERVMAADAAARRAHWEQRKRAYLAHLADAADEVLLVSGCDKLHNARAIFSDLQHPAVGAAVFARFTGGRDGTLWYYRSLVDIFTARRAPPAHALSHVVDLLHRHGA